VKENKKYLKFWGEFGRALKEGVSSDYENKEKLVPVLLFESSNDQILEQKITSRIEGASKQT